MKTTSPSSSPAGALNLQSIKYQVSKTFSQKAHKNESFEASARSTTLNFFERIFSTEDPFSKPGLYVSKDISDQFCAPIKDSLKGIAADTDELFVQLMQRNPEGFNNAANKMLANLAELSLSYGAELPEGFNPQTVINAIFRDCVAALPDNTLHDLLQMDDGQWGNYDNLALSVILNQVLERMQGPDAPVSLSCEDKIILHTRVGSYASAFQSSELEEGSLERIGEGLSHSVAKGAYALGSKDGQTTVKVFKEMEDKIPARAWHFQQLLGLPRPDSHPRYAERNIATSLLAEQLELPVIVRTDLAMHKGKRGIVMEYCTAPTELTQDRTSHVHSLEHLRRKHPSDYELLIKDPQYKRDRAALQLIDSICGQFDRHDDNFVVLFEKDPQELILHYKGLRGIDNDGCFGSTVIPQFYRKAGGYSSHHWKDSPKIIDQKMAQAVNKLTREDLQVIGNNRLTDAEIKAACYRLDGLKKAIYNGAITVIRSDGWENVSLQDL